MDNEVEKKRAAILCKDKKHSFEIIRDYKRRFIYKILAILLSLVGILTMVLLSSIERKMLGGLIIFLTLATSGVLMLLQARCVICDSFRYLLRQGEGLFYYNENYVCPNCRLSDLEVSRYIGILKSGVEIDETNINRILDKNSVNRITDKV